MIPGIAILVPLYFLAIHLGLHNTYTSMILIYSAWQAPTVVWITKGFFETIPTEIEDAARVDGCTSLRILWQIMLPIIQPGLAAAAMIAFVYIWNDFLIAATFVTDQNLRLINVGLYQFLSQYGIVWGQLMAAVMITLLPLVVMFVLLERRFIEGLTLGATKG
jgi:ABC-type glycerol-3-phosphate transport system permease component